MLLFKKHLRKGVKDSIIQYDKERGIHTMKLVNRIFLVLGAMSMFSLVQFDALAKCSDTPDAGEYCGGISVKDCIPGCYCIGGNKTGVGVTDSNLKNFCTEKQSANETQINKMKQAGIYLCPNSVQFSKEKAVSSLDCKNVEWCNNQPDSGKYCERKYKTSGSGSVIKSCPDGCWCEGKAKGQKAVGILNPFSSTGTDTIPLVAWCGRTGSNRVHNLESYLNERGVHYCPDDFPHSDNASEKVTNCYAKANETEGFGKMYYGQVTCTPGYFLKKGTGRAGLCIQCTSGSYCEGGTFVVSYKEDQGIESCPSGYSSGPAAKKITDCKNASGQNYVVPSGGSNLKPVDVSGLTVVPAVADTVYHCSAGQYLSGSTNVGLVSGTGSTSGSLNKFGTCLDCPAGSYCPGDDTAKPCTGSRRYSTAGQSNCSTCPLGRQANSTHTGCEPATINMDSTNVAAQRVEASDLVAWEAQCLNGGTPHNVYFVPGSDSATGTTAPKNNKCQGVTVTLPDSGFSLAGYTFNRWNCDNGIGNKVANATFSMPNANVTCTAQWTLVPAGTYTVQYLCGNGSGNAPTDNSSYALGASVILESNTCTPPSGYEFDKWSCVYGNNNTPLTITNNHITMPNANVTCTAQWTYVNPTIHCPAGGKYWNGNVCDDCPIGAYCPINDDDKHECSDNTYTNTTGNAVCTACPSGETAINGHTGCTSSTTVTCASGTYLPANSSACVQCQDGYGCSGGTFTVTNAIQGRQQCMPTKVSCQNHSACCDCPNGSHPDSTNNYSDCVDDNGNVVPPEDPDNPVVPISCINPGKYWDGEGCENCDTGYYCPGDGDEYTCPIGTPTANRASCKLDVSKTQMSRNKCWKYTGPSKASNYRYCVYGIRLEDYPH